MVQTSRVKDRRRLHFDNFDEAIVEAELLAKAEQQGTLVAKGNWSLGQAIGHLAYWASTPFDGYPEMRQPPWYLRVIVKALKSRLLRNGLPPGGRLPDAPEGTFGVEPMPTEEALAKLRFAFERLKANAPSARNPLFGELSHKEWIALNLRHAELHLGFFAIES